MHLFCFPTSKNTSDKYLTKGLTPGFILLFCFFCCCCQFLCFKQPLTEFLGISFKRKLRIFSVHFVYTFINNSLNCSSTLINWNRVFLNPTLTPNVSRPTKSRQSVVNSAKPPQSMLALGLHGPQPPWDPATCIPNLFISVLPASLIPPSAQR